MTIAIAHLKITLDDMEPAVIRRVEAPFDIRLDRLHLLIQAAMGWTNSHLYEIRAGDVGWGIPDPGWPDGPLDARKTRLADIVEDNGTKTLQYIYDFGDGWEHTIEIERLDDPEPGMAYPRLIEARGRCPPEDVGGPWGYGELLEAIADPKHERHAEFKEWIAEDFDPLIVDVGSLADEVAVLARKWSRKRAAKRPRRPLTAAYARWTRSDVTPAAMTGTRASLVRLPSPCCARPLPVPTGEDAFRASPSRIFRCWPPRAYPVLMDPGFALFLFV